MTSKPPAPDESLSHPYSNDPYIRTLAVSMTPCFGAYLDHSDVCKVCPLSSNCVIAAGVRKASIATKLEHEEQLERDRIEVNEQKKKKKDATVEELMASMSKSSFTAQKGQIPVASFAQRRDGVICAQCKETIPKDEKCFWVEGVGMFHIDCIDIGEA